MPAMFCEQGIAAREAMRLRSLFDASLCPMEYGLGRDETQLSVTSFAHVRLPGVDVMHDQGIGQRAGIRRPSHIRTHYADDFLLCLPHRAAVTLSQRHAAAHFGAGSFALLSTAQPFSARIAAERNEAAFSHTIVRVPGPRLRSRVPDIDDCCGTPMAIRAGVGRIMVSMFELALQEGGALSEEEARRFSDALIDAIAATMLAAPELAAARSACAMNARERLHRRACDAVRARLSDPELDADDIARQCGVSVRYLRAAFAERGESFGSFLRQTRLRECRNALRDPALATHSIIEIAMRWGFNDAAYFSRAYRREFGLPPSEERRLVMRGIARPVSMPT